MTTDLAQTCSVPLHTEGPSLPLHTEGPVPTCADTVGLIPQGAEVAIYAVGAQRPLVADVALAGPVPVPAAVPVAVAIPTAGPLGSTLACLEDIELFSQGATRECQ